MLQDLPLHCFATTSGSLVTVCSLLAATPKEKSIKKKSGACGTLFWNFRAGTTTCSGRRRRLALTALAADSRSCSRCRLLPSPPRPRFETAAEQRRQPSSRPQSDTSWRVSGDQRWLGYTKKSDSETPEGFEHLSPRLQPSRRAVWSEKQRSAVSSVRQTDICWSIPHTDQGEATLPRAGKHLRVPAESGRSSCQHKWLCGTLTFNSNPSWQVTTKTRRALQLEKVF